MQTGPVNAVVVPFDVFGNAGTGAGAKLLGDVLHEIVDDASQETRPTRTDGFVNELMVEELAFETPEQVAGWRETGRKQARKGLDAGAFLLWLSGNHLGVLPVLDELGSDSLVVQFDAHLDCYDLHDTTAELSHGNYLLHVQEPRPKVVNIGHRDLFLLPEVVKSTFVEAIPAEVVHTNLAKVAAGLRKRTAKAKRVWLDLDVDAFDPAFAPAVHQPQPFGLTPQQVLVLFEAVWGPKLIGMSISEFDPGRDVRDTTLNLLGWLVERILLKRSER